MTTTYGRKLYKVEFKRELSSDYYGTCHVYHIVTEEENFCVARKAIRAIMNDGSWTEGEWKLKNQREPSMKNGLHPYHKFFLDEKLDRYVYIYIRPYDD